MVRLLLLVQILLGLSTGFVLADSGMVDPLRPAQYNRPVKETVTPVVVKPDNSAEWQLTAVLISATRSVAVIDGRSVVLGDEFEGYKVTEIGADRVLLKSSQRTVELQRLGSGLRENLTERVSAQESRK